MTPVSPCLYGRISKRVFDSMVLRHTAHVCAVSSVYRVLYVYAQQNGVLEVLSVGLNRVSYDPELCSMQSETSGVLTYVVVWFTRGIFVLAQAVSVETDGRQVDSLEHSDN